MWMSRADSEQSGRFPHKSHGKDVNKQPASREKSYLLPLVSVGLKATLLAKGCGACINQRS